MKKTPDISTSDYRAFQENKLFSNSYPLWTAAPPDSDTTFEISFDEQKGQTNVKLEFITSDAYHSAPEKHIVVIPINDSVKDMIYEYGKNQLTTGGVELNLPTVEHWQQRMLKNAKHHLLKYWDRKCTLGRYLLSDLAKQQAMEIAAMAYTTNRLYYQLKGATK